MRWRWQDRYDFREHLGHRHEGLDADCANILEGRIELVDDEGNVILTTWDAENVDSGFEFVDLKHLRLIAAAPILQNELARAAEIYRRILHGTAMAVHTKDRFPQLYKEVEAALNLADEAMRMARES